jgi:hypothetical protein
MMGDFLFNGRAGRHPDIVYIVKEGDDNEELRYSLRSIKNLPHERVFIVGYKPSWVTGVEHIPVEQTKQKYKNASACWAAAYNSRRISNDFILMNDDFFIMKPINELPVLHMGNIEKSIDFFEKKDGKYSVYPTNLRNTCCALREFGIQVEDIKSYDLHVPMMINKRKYRRLAKLREEKVSSMLFLSGRTLYGNYYGIGGTEISDVKAEDNFFDFSRNSVFLSTNDVTFKSGKIGEYIRECFSEACEHEARHNPSISAGIIQFSVNELSSIHGQDNQMAEAI